MEKYIPLDAVVAEIEGRIKEVSQIEKASYEIGLFDAYKIVLSFINTLEVEEVDLDEEIEKCLKRHNMLAVGKKDFTDIAKHFYSLGMAASNKAQKG